MRANRLSLSLLALCFACAGLSAQDVPDSRAWDEAQGPEPEAGEPARRFEACLLASDEAMKKGDMKGAFAALDEARHTGVEDYRLYRKTISLYLATGDSAAAFADAQALFALAPADPASPEMVMEAYYAAKRYDELAAFFESGIRLCFNDNKALGNLYFHYSRLAHDTKDDEFARNLLDRAELSYERSGTANAQVLEAISVQRELCGE
jgi:hypothetical protein